MDISFESSDVIIEDGPFPFEREDRPRSRTWPILPPPIETIHEHECDAEIAEPPPSIEEVEEPPDETLKTETNPRKNSRKNAWGNLSYADLITRAIQSSPEQRLTLSQIYEWMVRNIPYFKDKGDSTSSAGWKNSIRHNLSLHSRFMRVQNDNNGKSSYWVINPDAKPGKSSRRSRSGSVDGPTKGDGKRRRNNKKLHQSTDDISALSPNAMKFKQNLSYDNLFNLASPCSSTDSLSNNEEFHNELGYPPYIGESFARPRSTSTLSQQSSINGRLTPVQIDIDEDLKRLEDNPIQFNAGGSAEETANLVETMSIDNNNKGRITSINLDDSMKMMKQEQKFNMSNDSLLNIRRPKSDSFGSGDSGYESPACFPSQQQQRPIKNMASPKIVPNKPPPPYNQGLNPQLSSNASMQQQQQMFYQQQQHQAKQQQQRMNFAPRLKHPPLQTAQNNFGPSYPQQQQQLMRGYQGLPNNHVVHSYNPYVQQKNMIVPNINIKINNMNQYHAAQVQPQQQQHQQQQIRTQMNTYNNDIPSDLTQVKLYDFDDPQQLANDLDAIIKDDLLTLNNNGVVPTSSSPHHNGFTNYHMTGQNWVS